MNKLLPLLAVLLSSCASADATTIQIPASETQRLLALNLSLTAEKLFKAYMSTDIEQRRFAEMYVAGVLDSTEGLTWCDYRIASPDALQEQVLAGLKETVSKNPQSRAPSAITYKLQQLLPCKEQPQK